MPAEPIGANDSAANPRSRGGSIGLGKRYRQPWRDTAEVYAAEHPDLGGAGLGPSTVQVTIPFRTEKTRDPHNYTSTVVKWIIDGLVRAGVWADDNPRHLTVLDPILEVSDTVTVTIEPRTT